MNLRNLTISAFLLIGFITLLVLSYKIFFDGDNVSEPIKILFSTLFTTLGTSIGILINLPIADAQSTDQLSTQSFLKLGNYVTFAGSSKSSLNAWI